MMKFGAFAFSVDTAAYSSLTRDTAYRWAAHECPGQTAKREYMGPGDDRISLPGTVYPAYAGGLGQVDAMRDAAAQGKPLLLVDSRGVIWGYWCIEHVRDTQRHFLPGGIPRKIEFTLEMTFYGKTL